MSGKREASSVTGYMDLSMSKLRPYWAMQTLIQQRVDRLKMLAPAGRHVGAHALQLLPAARAVGMHVVRNRALPCRFIHRVEEIGNCARNLAEYRQVAGDDRNPERERLDQGHAEPFGK